MASAFANVAASTTDSVLVAGKTGLKIRVFQVAAVSGGTVTTVTFNSKPGGAGTAVGPALAFGSNGGAVLPHSPTGWFDTNAGEGLSVTTGAGSTTGILVGYRHLPASAS